MTHLNGPVPTNSTAYVSRKFENEALAFLLKRDWVLILGPRQHGKTSALLRISAVLRDSAFHCAFVDLQRLPPGLAFGQLCGWFAGRIAKSLGVESPAAPRDVEDLSAWIEPLLPADGMPFVIMIDEASAIRDDAIRHAFLGQIRAFKTTAAVEGAWEARLVFAFAGTFRPEHMVDERNSPFNVCRRLEADDLTAEEVGALVLDAFEARDPELEAYIFENVGGQPHLVQLLIDAALRDDTGTRLSATTSRYEGLRNDGSEHTDSLFRMVVQDSALVTIAAEAAANKEIANVAANDDYKYMCVVGLMKVDGAKLVFRNKLFEEIAVNSLQIRPEQIGSAPDRQRFVDRDGDSLVFLADEQLREICLSAHNGAVSAFNNGFHRQAMVGCGVALEAVLIDWLTRQDSTKLSAAVTAAEATAKALNQSLLQSKEKPGDPMTWRLFSLERVAREMKGVTGKLRVPESLREMRNLVHPALIKASYRSDQDALFEALGALALLSQVLQDIEQASVP